MIEFRAIANANASLLSTWERWNGTAWVAATELPGLNDRVWANGRTVNINTDFLVFEMRNGTNGPPGLTNGGFFDYTTGIIVSADVRSATGLCLRNNQNSPRVFIGNAFGASGATGAPIQTNTNSTFEIFGSVTGGTSSSIPGLTHSGTGTVTLNGIAYGGTASTTYGVSNTGTGTIIVNGSVMAGTGSQSFGAFNQGTGTIIVLGEAIAGASANSYGAWNQGTGYIYAHTATASQQCQGIAGNSPAGLTIINRANFHSSGMGATFGYVRFSNTGEKSATIPLQNGNMLTLFDNSIPNYPPESAVKNLVQYGPSNIFTGTLQTGASPEDFWNNPSSGPHAPGSMAEYIINTMQALKERTDRIPDNPASVESTGAAIAAAVS